MDSISYRVYDNHVPIRGCIGDDISGLAFHQALLSAFNADNTIYEGQELVIIPSTTSIIPTIESLISIQPSISQLYYKLWNFLLPSSRHLVGQPRLGILQLERN
jgi:hypothetical protein